MWPGDREWGQTACGRTQGARGVGLPFLCPRPSPCPGDPLRMTSAQGPPRPTLLPCSSRWASLPSLTHSCGPPATLHQPPGRGPLIRPMNKSQRLLKRRAALSAIIKWCVSAEEGAIKTVWEEGKVREGASEALTLQLGVKGRQTMAWRAVSSRASCPGRQSRLCSRSHGPD